MQINYSPLFARKLIADDKDNFSLSLAISISKQLLINKEIISINKYKIMNTIIKIVEKS